MWRQHLLQIIKHCDASIYVIRIDEGFWYICGHHRLVSQDESKICVSIHWLVYCPYNKRDVGAVISNVDVDKVFPKL